MYNQKRNLKMKIIEIVEIVHLPNEKNHGFYANNTFVKKKGC